MDALTTYRLFAANPERTLQRISDTPQISREIAYYKENIGNVESAEDLVSDQRLLNVALRAYGLEEMNYARAFMQKLLEGGIDDNDSLANRLTDPRYQEFVKDFNFVRYGSATTSFERTQGGVVDKYYQQTMELEAGGQSDGARLALYFERKAGQIESALDILGDPAIFEFVRTAFGLPQQMSFASIDKQVDMINQRLNLEDLSDPQFMDDLVNQFLGIWDIQNPTAVSVPPLVSAPLGVQNLSIDLLASIQNLKVRL